MSEIIIPGREDDWVFQQFLATYDAPAYVRRARHTEAAYDDLLTRCRVQRAEWLELTRVRLGTLRTRAGTWDRLRRWLADDDQLAVLQELWTALEPAPGPADSVWSLRGALREVCDSLTFFNRRWEEFLHQLDLGPVNALRDGYNRYYVLEKECAVRSPRVARHGFQPLPPVTREELAAHFPTLPVPALAG